MDNYINLIMIFTIAFVTAFFMTPFVRTLALKLNAIDIPKDERRVHRKPIPRLGGLAILVGFLMALVYYLVVVGMNDDMFNRKIVGLLLGIIVIEFAGVWDDIKPIRAWTKLLFQIVAAAIVVGFGVRVEFLSNPFVENGIIEFSMPISILVSMVWIVGITNAINFIDGLDGLAAGVATISAISLLFIAIYLNQVQTIVLTAALAGATMGFLPFNFNPAKIFMGETGSAFLGFTLGTIAIMGLVKNYTAIAIIVPLVVLGLPIFDTAFAILRRIWNKKSPMQADRGHLHHRLVDSGLSQKQSVIILYIISAFLGLAGIVLIETGIWKFTLLIIMIVIFILAGSRSMVDMAHEEKEGDNNEKN